MPLRVCGPRDLGLADDLHQTPPRLCVRVGTSIGRSRLTDVPVDENRTELRERPLSTAKVAGHPIHPMLVPFPITCFVGTLGTDLAYWRTADVMRANFSAWLLLAGLVMGALAAIAGLLDFLGNLVVRAQSAAWLHIAGIVLVIVLSLFNAFVHSRDGWTSVVPTGLTLSAIMVLLLLFTGWLGWTMVYRHHTGIAP